MSIHDAQWKKKFKTSHRALPCLFLSSILIIASCKREEIVRASGEEMCHLDQGLELDAELGEASKWCNTNNTDGPLLYAHTLTQSARDEVCSEDVPSNNRGTIKCAPGPILIANGSSVDTQDSVWILDSLPDYFAWHLDDKSSVDEKIYIANANGFPIKSQSVKLENDRNATLVLFPKTALLPGTKYYLYLLRSTAQTTERWIQPIVTTATRD